MSALSAMANPAKTNRAVVRHKDGSSHSYSYESIVDVVEIVTSALGESGLAMRQRIEPRGESYEMVLSVYDEDEELELDRRPYSRMPDVQAQGSWETYTRRYQIKTAFNLVGEDDDGQAAAAKPERRDTPAEPAGDYMDPVRALWKQYVGLRGDADTAMDELLRAIKADDMMSLTPPQAAKAEYYMRTYIQAHGG